MNTKQKVFNLLKENKKRELSKKVDLGLIDNFEYSDISTLEDEYSNLSYLAYDWFDEKFEEYRQAWMALNDVFTHGAGNQVSIDDMNRDIEILDEIKVKAEELGLAPQEVYDDYDEHLRIIEEIRVADEQFEENKRKFESWS